ncbi:hypothetical protein M5689_006816 [Euphorbia peplus]|nr:hypothetical protein M5689_006816 [Euphorbia peplus]
MEGRGVQRAITTTEGSNLKRCKMGRNQRKRNKLRKQRSVDPHPPSYLEKPVVSAQGVHQNIDADSDGVTDKNDVSRQQKELDLFSELDILDDHLPFGCSGRTVLSFDLEYAEIALKSYEEERQEANKFVILRVLFSNRVKLAVRGYEGERLWCHVSFIAEPRNSGCCIDDSTKHFFGEMVFDRAQEKYNVTYCSIFDPSDPSVVRGCVFCPQSEVYLHPADGCPANGRESGKMMAPSQGRTSGCSKRHPKAYTVYRHHDDVEIHREVAKYSHLKYAKSALEFYEKSKDAEFEIVEVLDSQCMPIVRVSNVKKEWWCHVVFTAKPRSANFGDVSPKYFFGELLQDPTTWKYNASYCEIFTPSDRKITHGCVICPPLAKHPFEGFHVGHPPLAIAD